MPVKIRHIAENTNGDFISFSLKGTLGKRSDQQASMIHYNGMIPPGHTGAPTLSQKDPGCTTSSWVLKD